MKVTNIKFNNLTELQSNLDLSDLDPNQTLVQIFTGSVSSDEIAQIQSILKQKNSDINYVGITSSEETTGTSSFDKEILVSIAKLDDTTQHSTFFNADNHHLVLGALTSLSNSVRQELEETQQQLQQQASRDPLTGLYNRGYFTELSSKLLAMARREGRPLSAIMLNIDNFEKLNQQYGHTANTEVIKSIAPILSNNTRDVDIISRLDNGEFAIVLPHANKNGAYQVAERLRKEVEQQEITLGENQIHQCTISLGIDSFRSEQDKDIDIVLSRASDALHTAHIEGKNRAVINREKF